MKQINVNRLNIAANFIVFGSMIAHLQFSRMATSLNSCQKVCTPGAFVANGLERFIGHAEKSRVEIRERSN